MPQPLTLNLRKNMNMENNNGPFIIVDRLANRYVRTSPEGYPSVAMARQNLKEGQIVIHESFLAVINEIAEECERGEPKGS